MISQKTINNGTNDLYTLEKLTVEWLFSNYLINSVLKSTEYDKKSSLKQINRNLGKAILLSALNIFIWFFFAYLMFLGIAFGQGQGIIVLIFNLFNEMIFEFYLFFSILILSLILSISLTRFLIQNLKGIKRNASLFSVCVISLFSLYGWSYLSYAISNALFFEEVKYVEAGLGQFILPIIHAGMMNLFFIFIIIIIISLISTIILLQIIRNTQFHGDKIEV